MNGYDWQNGRPHSNSNSPAPLNFQSIQHLYPEHFKNNSLDQLHPHNHPAIQVHSDNNSYDNIASLKYSDESIPLSLTAQELTLQESKTYMRWYSDILARTNSRTVTINDVYTFLNNFKIPQDAKEKINKIFFKILSSINIGEFFALLRVISHVLLGQEPARNLIKAQAPVPAPPSILSKKRQNEEEEEPEPDQADQQPLDIDSFTQFLLTGERPSSNKRSKKLKSVKFSDEVDVHDASAISPAESPLPVEQQQQQMDYLLPMDKLLERMKKPDEEEKEVLKDMESQMNHFQHLNTVDTMSVGGTPYLQPNMTGPAQMARLFSPSPEPLRPNITGPADMARMFSPPSSQSNNNNNLNNDNNNNTNDNNNNGHPVISLSAFSSQMTGPTMQNTIQNSHLAPAPPPSRHRSLSSPLPNKPAPPPPPPRRNRMPLQPMEQSSQYPQQQQQLQQQQQYPMDPNAPPPLPPKIAVNDIYSNNNDSTANILDDLKALQEEVDKIRDLTGGF
ncbi:Protein SCD5 [Candida viswanathii]|uniref:Protein SCD5 n=1 Tax=Candida viswanathii TaxID=5486 RepID=A0A367YJ99_9ASCO|nr:Protein SCD5 [Candida viswanathii]